MHPMHVVVQAVPFHQHPEGALHWTTRDLGGYGGRGGHPLRRTTADPSGPSPEGHGCRSGRWIPRVPHGAGTLVGLNMSRWHVLDRFNSRCLGQPKGLGHVCRQEPRCVVDLGHAEGVALEVEQGGPIGEPLRTPYKAPWSPIPAFPVVMVPPEQNPLRREGLLRRQEGQAGISSRGYGIFGGMGAGETECPSFRNVTEKKLRISQQNQDTDAGHGRGHEYDDTPQRPP
jgi:hypothetical protein